MPGDTHAKHPIEALIERADRAIEAEDFDTLIELYTEDAVLVVRPGLTAVGHDQLRRAFEAIAAHLDHSVSVRQAGMHILEAGDTALVLARTVVRADNAEQDERAATYVFRRAPDGRWLCAIDNSYGHDVIE
jgi:uncharacterized protein (TIGR02246 family)